MSNNFDKVAPIYDTLAKLVFGSAIRNSQTCYLGKLKAPSNVLIIGGGTGWILEEFTRISGVFDIDYVEASEKMIARSRKRSVGENRVRFIHTTHENLPEGKYDMIITNFFLDVFKEEDLPQLVPLLKSKLNSQGIWLCTDFKKTNRPYHRFLLFVMLRFFRAVANLEARQLADFHLIFEKNGMNVIEKQEFFRGMIFAVVLKPSTNS